LKGKDVTESDVRGKSSVCDFMVIASGTSTRHVKSIADEVVRFAKRLDVMPLGVEGEREAEWVLVELGDVVVHVMLPRVREFYALERLWTVGDQPPDDTGSEAAGSRRRARLVAVGERAPAWVAEGFAEYRKRLSHWLPLDLVEVEPGVR